MNRSMLIRIVDAFFRRWYLYVIPLVLMFGLGLVNAGGGSGYTTNGTVFVDQGSFVTERTGIDVQGLRTYLTPAQFARQELYGLLQTDVFLDSVLIEAGIELSDDPGDRVAQRANARSSISTWATSENLLSVRATTDDPMVSEALAVATIDGLIDFKIQIDTAESAAAGTFFAELAATYEEQVTLARAELDGYLEAISARSLEQLTPTQQTELDRLTTAVTAAEARYQSTNEDLEASRLAVLQAQTDVQQSFSVVDPPQAASQPDATSLTEQLLTVLMFTLVGVILVVVGPVIAAMLNRTILLPDELPDVVEGGLVAVVPAVTRRDGKLPKTPKNPVTGPENAATPRDDDAEPAEPDDDAEPAERPTVLTPRAATGANGPGDSVTSDAADQAGFPRRARA